jgi:hypothetical protein
MGPGMSKLAPLSALAATLLTASLAHADDDAPGMMQPSVAAQSADAPKDADTALYLSLGGTAASAALTIAGLSSDNGGLALAGIATSLVTPSLGEWYAGKPLTAGMGIRAASAVATIVGFGEALSCLDEQDCRAPASAEYLMFGGLAGYAVGTIYDIVTAKSAAREYNAQHGWHVTVAPTALRTASGTSTMGVGIGGSF